MLLSRSMKVQEARVVVRSVGPDVGDLGGAALRLCCCVGVRGPVGVLLWLCIEAFRALSKSSSLCWVEEAVGRCKTGTTLLDPFQFRTDERSRSFQRRVDRLRENMPTAHSEDAAIFNRKLASWALIITCFQLMLHLTHHESVSSEL